MVSFVVEDGTGNANATSYVSVAEADDIASMNIHTDSAWAALSTADKQNLLIYVSRTLDARTAWNGARATTAQAMEWPRKDVVDRYGNKIASNVVPYVVKWAVVEIAKRNINSDLLSVRKPERVLSEVKIDSVTVKFDKPASIATDVFDVPDIVKDLLRGIAVIRNSTSKVTFGRVVRI